MRTEVKTITPKQAQEWLDECQSRMDRGAFRQRPISEAHARRLASQIRLGMWHTTHQGIAFDTDGNLVDGRHRLRAIVLANTPIKINVTTGITAKADNGLYVMDAMDRGKPRSVGHQLQMHGFSNGNLTAAVINAIVETVNAGRQINALECGQSILIYDLIRKDYETIVPIATNANNPEFRSAFLAPMILLASTNRDAAIDFCTKLVTLENIPKGHPVLALKVWDRNHVGLIGGRDNRQARIRVMCSALKSHVEGAKLSKIYAAITAQEWLQSLNKKLSKQIIDIASPKDADTQDTKRNLTKSQRAAFAVDLIPILETQQKRAANGIAA